MKNTMDFLVCFGFCLFIIQVVKGIVCKKSLEDYKSLDFVFWKRTRYTSLVQCAVFSVLDRRCKGMDFNKKTFQCKCFVRPGYRKNLTSQVESYYLACGHTQRLDKKGFLPGYIGCYESMDYDTQESLLDDVRTKNVNETAIWCLRECMGYWLNQYAALQKSVCFCSDVLEFERKKRPDEECKTPCRKNRAQYCGGRLRLAVYYFALNEEP